MKKFINKNFFHRNINSKNNKIHDYRRNSKQLAWNWKKKRCKEYEVIEEICQEGLRCFYPDMYK